MHLFRHFSLCVILSVITLSGLYSANAEMRTWTSATGASIEAEFVETRMDQVILKKADDSLVDIRLNQLSREDQILVGTLRQASLGSTGAGTQSDADAPPELTEMYGKRLVDAKGKKRSPAELVDKKIGLYFSASWCPPCRAFTPDLVKFYNEVTAAGKPFEIVLVPHDRSEKAARDYMRDYDMPWLALRFDGKEGAELKRRYKVSGIPKLVIVDAQGNILSDNARAEVSAQGAAAFDKW